jgi:hypothetical protein
MYLVFHEAKDKSLNRLAFYLIELCHAMPKITQSLTEHATQLHAWVTFNKNIHLKQTKGFRYRFDHYLDLLVLSLQEIEDSH